MARKRTMHSSQLKAKAALAAVKGDKQLSELSSQFGVHSTQISAWKRRLVEGAAELFEDGRRRPAASGISEEELYEQIGRLKVELEWLKKKAARYE